MVPGKLYKYRKFDAKTLRLITDHELHYANPRLFNDPLDCAFEVNIDIGLKELVALLRGIYGPDRKEEFQQEMGHNLYLVSEEGDWKTDKRARAYLERRLAWSIESQVRHEFDSRGVLSFSATWKSVLMWSHYADEHRGICLEFDTSELQHEHLSPVNYGGERSVLASDLLAWKLLGDLEAEKRAFNKHFYSKAPEWRYEKEWRDISDQPCSRGDYRISGIYFGFRCDYAIKVAIVKMLGVETDVKLFEVALSRSSFKLRRIELDTSEIDAVGMSEPSGILAAQLVDDLKSLEWPDHT
jgi:hypothetical protein